MNPADGFRQIRLTAVVFLVEMRILIPDPAAKSARAPVMGILQIRRDGEIARLSDEFSGGRDRVDRRIALGRARHIGGRLRQEDLGLGHTDPLTGQ